VLGNFPLHEALADYWAEGGMLSDLPRIASVLDEATLGEM
jgi:hypothetical protein